MAYALIPIALLLAALAYRRFFSPAAQLFDAISRNDTADVVALARLRLTGAARTEATEWLNSRREVDTAHDLERAMAAEDVGAIRALLMVRGDLLSDDLREAVEEWLGDDEDDEGADEDDVPNGPPLRGEKLPITSCPTDKMPGSMSVLVFGDGNATEGVD